MKIIKIKKTALKFIKSKFFRYLLVGSSSVIVDLLTLFVLVDCFNVSSVLAVVINQFIVYLYVFLLNKTFVFKADGNLGRQAVRYCQLAVFNYIVTVFWMYFFAVILEQNYLIVRFANIILATSWNFFIYRNFVYKQRVKAISIDNYR